jgi:hypothetical protein
LETVPATVPYVRATEAGAWRERIPDDGVYKVGICWAGGQKQAHRWIPPAQIDRLTAGVPGVRFYSLQKEMPAGDGARPAGLIDFMPEVGDFADTAGLVDALDRVITVDTSVAHVAGALAKRMWVAVPRQVDWRWLTGRADSPWYPTATLFRQETFGDWSAVVDRMAEALRDEVASRRGGQ